MTAPQREYPEMTVPVLETVIRMTIDKVRIQRSGGTPPPQTPNPSASEDQQQAQKPRSKSASLLRSLLIIQIGRKASRLLTLINQPDVLPLPPPPPPAVPVASPPPVPVVTRIQASKRRSSDEEESEDSGCSVTPIPSPENRLSPPQPAQKDGPSAIKSPRTEEPPSPVFVFPPRPQTVGPLFPENRSEHSGQLTPVSGLNQLSLQNSPIHSCPGCNRCGVNPHWTNHHHRPTGVPLCQPMKQC